MKKPREVFIVSDGTALTAEKFSQSILAQFSTPFRLIRKPFVDSVSKAASVTKEINSREKITGLQPIVFTTLVKPEISDEILKSKYYSTSFGFSVLFFSNIYRAKQYC